jgi:hypothetical protein
VKRKTTRKKQSKEKSPTYRLMPELVPAPLWRVSAYRLFGKTKPWKEIRQDTLERAGNKCGACDADGPQLSCHDAWSYDDKTCVATLIGFEIRCHACHNATHIGRANALGFEQDAHAQLRRVNGCTQREVDAMVEAAMGLWEKRSRKAWTVAVAAELLRRYPRLAEVPLMVDARTPTETAPTLFEA